MNPCINCPENTTHLSVYHFGGNFNPIHLCTDCINIYRENEARCARKIAPNLAQFAEFAQAFAIMPSAETPLTWGYEIESNTMANVKAKAEEVAEYKIVKLVSWQQDGSVSDESDYAGNEECECECDDCYHSCNCDSCDYANGNRDLEHECGNSDCYGGASDTQEVASIGGITYSHPETLERLAEWGINEATYNEDTGIHVHIGSENFTTPQVANIMTAYRLAKPILDQVAERAETYYALSHTPEMENETRSGNNKGHKYQAVNISNQFQDYRAKTIEFRQMAGTTRTTLNQTDRVRAWAFILRALVAYATKPSPSLYWIGKAKDFNDLMRLITA
jgi:hypothetical protein